MYFKSLCSYFRLTIMLANGLLISVANAQNNEADIDAPLEVISEEIGAEVNDPVVNNNGENPTIILNFQDADIRALIDTVSQITEKNFLVDPRVRGNFTIISGKPLDASQVYEVFLSILKMHELAAVPEGDLTKIVPSSTLRSESLPTVTDIQRYGTNEVVTYVYEVKNGSVQSILPIIQPLLPPSSFISAHSPSNTLIISSTKGNIERLLDIVDKVDTSDKTLDVNILYLQNTKASRVAGIIQKMITNMQELAVQQGQLSNFNISIQADDSINALIIHAPTREQSVVEEIVSKLDIQRTDIDSDIHIVYLKHSKASRIAEIITGLQSQTPTTGTDGVATIAEESSKIQSDDNLNAIIIQASFDRFIAMKTIIDQLDVEKGEDSGNIHVYYLKHAKADEISGILNTILVDGAASQSEDIAVDNPVEVKIEADVGSNALIIRSDDKDYTDIKKVIAGLDIRRSQVYVEAIIAEVLEGDTENFGVEWQSNKIDPGNVSGLLSSQTDFDLGTGGLSVGLLRGNISVGGTQILPEFNVILNALRSDSNSNILSTPNLLTLENEEAEIVVGQEVPFITGEFTDGDNESNNTVSADRFRNIERQNVGLTLKVKPQINEGDIIRLDIDQEVSDIAQTQVQGQSDIITNTRQIKTVVEVNDGQIVVLGGLIQDTVTDSVSSVPILGKIPILGALFRNKTKTAGKRNLMIFLKPKIVNNGSDLSEKTRDKYNKLQSSEMLSLPDSRFLLREIEPPILPDIDWTKEKGAK